MQNQSLWARVLHKASLGSTKCKTSRCGRGFYTSRFRDAKKHRVLSFKVGMRANIDTQNKQPNYKINR